jgi:uncharacterized membrane protein YphA (DoxX/SURF4 family)
MMPKNPITDLWQFLIAATPDHLELGSWRYLLGVLFAALLIGSVAVAWWNWSRDPEQRTGRHLSTWAMRTLIGCMWFEGMLWKLPLPASSGLQYWTEQMASRAAFDLHRNLVRDVLLPHLALFGPVVFLAELTFAVALMLGIGVRLVGPLAALFVTNLWLGIYRSGDPAEWPWSYVFLMMLMLMFSLYAAGRSLGLDALLRREVASVRDGRGLLGRFFHVAG